MRCGDRTVRCSRTAMSNMPSRKPLPDARRTEVTSCHADCCRSRRHLVFVRGPFMGAARRQVASNYRHYRQPGGGRSQVLTAADPIAVSDGPPTAPQDAFLIAVSREGDFSIAPECSHLAPGNRALHVVSLERFREG